MQIFNDKKYSGVIDLGTTEQKNKLFQMRELVSAPAPVSLGQTSPDRWKIWPKRNQMSQSSCVFHARAKMAGILHEIQRGEFIEFSASDYNKRSNRPADGAYPVEALDLLRKEGIGLEVLEPSNNISAEQLAATVQSGFDKQVAGLSLLDAFYQLPAYDFDTIISTLHATGKPIPLGFFATVSEWNRDVPKIIDAGLFLNNASVRHEVCATPNFGIYGGEEGFTIEDSWGSTGINGMGVRFITRNFFEKRNYIPGLVPTSFKGYSEINVAPVRPKVLLERDLEKGMTGEDVRALQAVYKFEGLFPANHAGSDYFGEITERCTKEYQKKYGIISEGSPETTGFGRVGPKTRAQINKLYK